MKKTQTEIDTTRLADLIAKFALSKREIAKAVNMPESTFKLKLSPKIELYKFTPLEYSETIRAVGAMAISILEFSKKEAKVANRYIDTKK
jgi:hypothetical protein